MENDFNPNDYPDYRKTEMELQQEFEAAMAKDEYSTLNYSDNTEKLQSMESLREVADVNNPLE